MMMKTKSAFDVSGNLIDNSRYGDTDTAPPSRTKTITAEPCESLAEMYGATIPLDAASPSENKPTSAEVFERLAELYGDTIHLDTGSPSRNKPKAKEPYESLFEVYGATIPPDTGSSSRNKPQESLEDMCGRKLPYGWIVETEEEAKAALALENDELRCPCSYCWFADKENVPKLRPDEYLDYFPDRYVIGSSGDKLYRELLRPKKRKKPKTTEKECDKRFGEKREDMDDAFFRAHKGAERRSRLFAGAALSYMRERGHNLELVKPGLYEGDEIALGLRLHFNFKAKRDDDPSAPVETYFGQLRYYAESDIVVECCVSMGESDTLPYDRDNRGCGYCTKYVHHPLGGCKGIIWGLLTRAHHTGMYIIT